MNIIKNIKLLAACAVLALAACTQHPHHEHSLPAEQKGQMTVYQTVQPDNSFLWWYLLSSNGHTYYYHTSTYIPSSSYSSMPMTSLPRGASLPTEVEQAKEIGTVVENSFVSPEQEPAVAEAEISADRISELQAEEAAEIAADQHADEAAEAQSVSPTSESSSSESSSAGEPSSSSDSSSSDSSSSSSSSSD